METVIKQLNAMMSAGDSTSKVYDELMIVYGSLIDDDYDLTEDLKKLGDTPVVVDLPKLINYPPVVPEVDQPVVDPKINQLPDGRGRIIVNDNLQQNQIDEKIKQKEFNKKQDLKLQIQTEHKRALANLNMLVDVLKSDIADKDSKLLNSGYTYYFDKTSVLEMKLESLDNPNAPKLDNPSVEEMLQEKKDSDFWDTFVEQQQQKLQYHQSYLKSALDVFENIEDDKKITDKWNKIKVESDDLRKRVTGNPEIEEKFNKVFGEQLKLEQDNKNSDDKILKSVNTLNEIIEKLDISTLIHDFESHTTKTMKLADDINKAVENTKSLKVDLDIGMYNSFVDDIYDEKRQLEIRYTEVYGSLSEMDGDLVHSCNTNHPSKDFICSLDDPKLIINDLKNIKNQLSRIVSNELMTATLGMEDISVFKTLSPIESKSTLLKLPEFTSKYTLHDITDAFEIPRGKIMQKGEFTNALSSFQDGMIWSIYPREEFKLPELNTKDTVIVDTISLTAIYLTAVDGEYYLVQTIHHENAERIRMSSLHPNSIFFVEGEKFHEYRIDNHMFEEIKQPTTPLDNDFIKIQEKLDDLSYYQNKLKKYESGDISLDPSIKFNVMLVEKEKDRLLQAIHDLKSELNQSLDDVKPVVKPEVKQEQDTLAAELEYEKAQFQKIIDDKRNKCQSISERVNRIGAEHENYDKQLERYRICIAQYDNLLEQQRQQNQQPVVPEVDQPDVVPEVQQPDVVDEQRAQAVANNQQLGIEEVQKKKSGGGGSDWKVRPTFGLSHNTNSQLVQNGFTLNGYTTHINDNFHTEWLKTSSIIGDENHVRIISYAADGFKHVTLSLGVPEIGKSADAETSIVLNMDKDYSKDMIYSVSDITHEQKENLIDESATRATVNQVYCNGGSNTKNCYAFDVWFTVLAPLSHDVISITAVDEKRRTQTTYINDGVEFTGTSLLEAETKELWHDKKWITLTQDDRRYNTWTDDNGYKWEENSFGTMTQSTFPDFERYQDDYSSVMKRTNSNFELMVQHEKDRALQVWNGTHFILN